MPLGMMQSNTLMRSVATNNSVSPRSYTSRTFPRRTGNGRSDCSIASCMRGSVRVKEAKASAATGSLLCGENLPFSAAVEVADVRAFAVDPDDAIVVQPLRALIVHRSREADAAVLPDLH